MPGKIFPFQSMLDLNASTTFILKLSATTDCIASLKMVRPWKVPEWVTKIRGLCTKKKTSGVALGRGQQVGNTCFTVTSLKRKTMG